jgi:hypothetical protein
MGPQAVTIDEYLTQYPTERVWPNRAGEPGVIAVGMLQFDDTAAHFAGPFQGGFAYFRLADMRDMPGWGPLLSVAEYKQRHRFSQYNLPWRLKTQYGKPAESEEHLQKRLALLTAKELKEWEKRIAAHRLDMPTLEFPYALKLAGNDDSTYTKFYPTLEAAQAELDLFLSDQPLNFPLHVHENGFVFTN